MMKSLVVPMLVASPCIFGVAAVTTLGCGSSAGVDASGQVQSSQQGPPPPARGAWLPYSAFFPQGLPPADGTDDQSQAVRNRNIAVSGPWVWFRGSDAWPNDTSENNFIYKTLYSSATVIKMNGAGQEITASASGQSWVGTDDGRLWSQHANGDNGYDLRNGGVAPGASISVDTKGDVWALGAGVYDCGGHSCIYHGSAPAYPASIVWQQVAPSQGADMIANDLTSGIPWIAVGTSLMRFTGSSFVAAGVAPVSPVTSFAVNVNPPHGTTGNAYVAGPIAGSGGRVYRQTFGPNSPWELLPDANHFFTNIAAYGTGVIAIANDNTIWYWVDAR